MSEPILTELAEADLEDVWFTIARHRPDAADRIIDAILEASRLHCRFPGMGQAREDLMTGLRCFPVSSYVVFYRPVEGAIEILRILHAARDVPSFFKE